MKIFAAGISTESNTFAPIPTALADFLVQRGRDALVGRIEHPSLDLSDLWGKPVRALGHDFVFSLMAYAEPGGTTVQSAYETLREEILRDLRVAMPVDVILLMLHGAMVAQQYDDCEEDLIRQIRAIVGSEAIIAAELDLHCHLSAAKIAAANIVITYKEFPHTDVDDRARELLNLAVAARLGECQPTMALFDCQMVGLYPTTRQPLRDLVDTLTQLECRGAALSVSFGHGFPFADVPHVGAKMLVVTDGDRCLAEQLAHELGMRAYRLRREIGFESLSLPLDEALSKALAIGSSPVVVADQSDNPGGGAPGDATFALRWLLDRKIQGVAMGTLYDPEVVKIAKRAGRGARVTVRLGGKLGPLSGDPVDMEVTVLAMRDRYQHQFPQKSGPPQLYPLGDVVALRCNGIDLVVTSERCQCYDPSLFGDLGIELSDKRLIVVKSIHHFYATFAPMASAVIYMSTPGALAPDPRNIAYRRLDTQRLYPWIDDPLGVEPDHD